MVIGACGGGAPTRHPQRRYSSECNQTVQRTRKSNHKWSTITHCNTRKAITLTETQAKYYHTLQHKDSTITHCNASKVLSLTATQGQPNDTLTQEMNHHSLQHKETTLTHSNTRLIPRPRAKQLAW